MLGDLEERVCVPDACLCACVRAFITRSCIWGGSVFACALKLMAEPVRLVFLDNNYVIFLHAASSLSLFV